VKPVVPNFPAEAKMDELWAKALSARDHKNTLQARKLYSEYIQIAEGSGYLGRAAIGCLSLAGYVQKVSGSLGPKEIDLAKKAIQFAPEWSAAKLLLGAQLSGIFDHKTLVPMEECIQVIQPVLHHKEEEKRRKAYGIFISSVALNLLRCREGKVSRRDRRRLDEALHYYEVVNRDIGLATAYNLSRACLHTKVPKYSE
jgi:hypothetical protein